MAHRDPKELVGFRVVGWGENKLLLRNPQSPKEEVVVAITDAVDIEPEAGGK